MQVRFRHVTGGRAAVERGTRRAFELRELPLFSNLDRRALRELEESVRRQTFRRRAVVFEQGDTALCMCIVLAGHVRLSRRSADGREVSIAFIGPGGTIGEEAVFAEGAYAWSATCCSDTTVAALARPQVRRSLRTDPTFAVNVAAVFQLRLERMSAMLEHIAYDRVSTRLFELLRLLAAEAGTADAEGLTFRLDFTHHDIAALIASTRETVSAELANLVQSGRIRIRERRVVTLCGIYPESGAEAFAT